MQTAMQTPFDSGWGDMTSPTASSTKASNAGGFNVQQDEEFGGWSHASPVATSAGGAGAKPSGGGGGGFGGGSDDLFGNVWE
jgi:stromal membrane-associated protein